MSKKSCNLLVFGVAFFLVISGLLLYWKFDRMGLSNNSNNKVVSYDVREYTSIAPLKYDNLSDVYSNITVSYIDLFNLPKDVMESFVNKEDELIGYINSYYEEIKNKCTDDYIPINTVTSVVKSQVNGAVLSIFYELDFSLDSAYFSDTSKKFIIVFNYDLKTNKLMSTDDLLVKFDYEKSYLANKLFEEEIAISNNDVVIDKETNISLTGKEVEKKKDKYVSRIEENFDNIIKVYIENNSLALVYNKRELNEMFFETEYADEIVFRYLK